MRGIVLTWLFFLSAALAHGQECLPSPPEREHQDRLVWQFTGFLDPREEARLNAKLVRFAQESSNRILVIVVDDLCGYPPSDFAFRIGETWGVGDQKFDNGCVVLVKPTGGSGRRKAFIATGYGLEGAIPDAVCKRIVENQMLPAFRNGDAFGGLDKATDVLMGLAQGEINAQSYDQRSFPWMILVPIGVLTLLGVLLWVARVRRYARLNDVDFWTAANLLSEAEMKHTRRWQDFRTGRGSFGAWPVIGGGSSWGGGSGRSGFGGFGGGGFGGGGAGGSW
jgi:uncharacterized protein